jgi:hypothetical protein
MALIAVKYHFMVLNGTKWLRLSLPRDHRSVPVGATGEYDTCGAVKKKRLLVLFSS